MTAGKSSRVDLGLGIEGFEALPELAGREDQWARALHRMESTVYLRSEGTSVSLGCPQELSPELTARAERLVRAYSKFSDHLVREYFERPERADDHLVNPILAPMFEIDRDTPILTAANRLDCVLTENGELVVIENNSVGVCVVHFRNLLYLVRGLWKAGLTDAAERVDSMSALLSEGFRAAYRRRVARARGLGPEAAHELSPTTVGVLVPHGYLRAGRILFRAAFERTGWRAVWGTPSQVEARDDGLYLCGERIDVLWSDLHFYLAYQCARYQQTRFPTRMVNFDNTPGELRALVENERFLGTFRRGQVALVSPSTAYLCLAKPLLARLHQPLPGTTGIEGLSGEDLEWLREHVARTYSVHERHSGALTRDEAMDRQGELVAKPALYGGSFGVTIGRSCSTETWRARLDELWDDPSWTVQEMKVPARTRRGAWVSLGLMGYGETFGGGIVRTGDDLTISARDADFVPALPARR